MLVIEIAEKIGLMATAGLVSVLVPPLRNRLLGVGGQPRDRLMALLLGILFAMWGAKMGEWWLGIHVNVHAIGVLMAAILGGGRVGLVTGLLAGLFYVYRVEPSLGMLGVLASTLEGAFAGFLVEKRPQWMSGWRTFGVACGIEFSRFVVVAIGLFVTGGSVATFIAGWPALLVQMAGVGFGLAVFVVTTKMVLAREDAAVALVGARAAADHLALEALRRRLEPHFLFNALNTLRATIRTNPLLARELVNDLSDLYRYLLTHPDDASLGNELDHAVAYLAIEKARLGEGRLSVESDVPEPLRAARVPALLLQPLVENAVKHGVGTRDGAGIVRIEARRENTTLVVDVVDQTEGERLGRAAAGSGIALKTLRERLNKSFDDQASLELVPVDNGMCARVRLPWSEVMVDERSAA